MDPRYLNTRKQFQDVYYSEQFQEVKVNLCQYVLVYHSNKLL